MSYRGVVPQQVPTLTEVVELPALLPPPASAPASGASTSAASPPAAAVPLPGEAELVERVLADLQRRVDVALEQRIRESVGASIGRLSEQLVRDTSHDVAAALHELVATAVAQEMARLRGQGR